MIKFIALVILFFAAVAISPLLIGEKGYILIAMGNITIESTVVTASICLIVLFIVLLFSLKIFRSGIKLSVGSWNKIAFASKRRGERDYRKGIAAYLLGDYQQAEHLLVKSAEPSSQQSNAYLIAAKAAQAQQLPANASHYLQLLEHHQATEKNNNIESILVKLAILMEQNEIKKARTLLDQHHRYIGQDARLLSLEIRLSILEKRFENAISFIAKARKQKEINAEQIKQWDGEAYLGQFRQVIAEKDQQALNKYWSGLSRKEQHNDTIVHAYCTVLAENQITAPLDKLLVPLVKKAKNTVLINALKSLPLTKPNELIAATQKHLHGDQHNIFWLSCLGHFALKGKDWPLAERAFHSIANQSGANMPIDDRKGYAIALNEQGKYQQATEILLAQ